MLIEAEIKKIGNKINTMGGNCGVLAIAFCKLVKTKKCSIVLVSDAETEEDLKYGDVNIFHVIFGFNNKFYDGSGLIGNSIQTKQYIKKWMEEVYPYYQNSFGIGIYEANRGVFKVIEHNTNYTVSSEEIVNFVKTGGITVLEEADEEE